LAHAQHIAHLGNWDWNTVNNDLRWSDEIYRIFGLMPQQFGATYEAFLNSVHADDRQSVIEAVNEVLHKNQPYSIDHRVVRPDGTTRIVHEEAEVIFDENGKALRMIGTVQDITERKRSETALRENNEILGRIFDSTHFCLVYLDRDFNFIRVNRAYAQACGFPPEHFPGKNHFDLYPHEENEAIFRRVVQTGEAFTAIAKPFEYPDHPEWGVTYWDWTLHPLKDAAGNVESLLFVLLNVTERRRTEERLNYLAHYDALTGLPNRALLQDRLQRAMIEADRIDRLVAVMFLDLDRFKIINDTLGHDMGDALLESVAERLSGCVRHGDTISRLGGDEFTVVLSNVAHVDDVARLAQKIIDSFIPPFNINGRELFISTSIGITLYPFDDNNIDSLLRNADAAMYHAKEVGRNTFQFYTAELNRRAARRLQMETALRHALERDELRLDYQPQIDLKTGRITGMEALLRWRHPEMGLIPPLDFIQLAEETGLIVPIGEWVLRAACSQTRVWHDAGFSGLQIAVNLSGRQFQHRNLAKSVKKILRETGLDPRCLDLELTESILMHNTETTLATMNELNALGVMFSMDDFGTGYSSLSYLKRFPIDALKIDQSFVRDIPRDSDDAAIAQAIIAMAHSLGIQVIAEGVETAKQIAFLRAHKCDGMQGYYFSKPIPVDKMTKLLQMDRPLKPRQPAKAKKPVRRKPVRK
jgi:diguanylate cyclase (GGDEF)-like protein/PAS domain S-box-containing protein